MKRRAFLFTVAAALGNNTGEVLNVAEFKRLHSFTGLRKPTAR